MYFSLAPNPGYNSSFLDTCGIVGEWDLFTGNFFNENNATSGTWRWGSLNNLIEGMLDSQVRCEINYILLKMFGLRVDLM